ncbi:unnamed protein product [Ascophyllum nodosum]
MATRVCRPPSPDREQCTPFTLYIMVSDLICTAVHDNVGSHLVARVHSSTLSKYQQLNKGPKLRCLCTNNNFDEDPVKTGRAEWEEVHNYRDNVRLSPRNRLLQQVNCTHSTLVELLLVTRSE